MTARAHGCHGCQRVPRVPHPSPNVGAGGGHPTGANPPFPGPAPVESAGLEASTPPEKQATSATGAGEVQDSRHPSDATLLPILRLLARGPAIVATLAAELGASVHLVERRLYSLRRQGLVTSEWTGIPAVLTWRAL